MLPKIISAPANADFRVETSSTSPLTTSIPWAMSACDSGLEGSRVIPLILKEGSLRKVLATEPPCSTVSHDLVLFAT